MQEYIFPSVSSEIVDKSFATITSLGFTDCIQVIVSERGQDRKLGYYVSPSDFVQDYGDPSIKKYGQVNHNLYQWLLSGGAGWILRVTPDEATFAHIIIDIAAKKSVDGLSAVIKPTAYTVVTGLSEASSLLGEMQKNASKIKHFKANTGGVPESVPFNSGASDVAVDVDSDFKKFPILGFTPIGRGKYYNNYGVRLQCTNDYDATYKEFRTYNLTIVEVVNGRENILEGPFLVSFSDGSLTDSNQALFIERVVAMYAKKVKCVFNEKAYEDMGEYLGVNPDLMDVTSPSIQDYKNAPNIWSHLTNGIKWATNASTDTAEDNYTADPKFVSFANTIRLSGGEDGDLSLNNIVSLKVKAYTGLVDPQILDKMFIPTNVILDGNEDVGVKDAMVKLALTRGDCVAILDTGFTGSPDQALELRDNGMGWDTCFAAIFTQDMETYDAFAKGDSRVTSTYFLASKIPLNDIAHGRHVNFVGPRRGGVGSFKNICWLPNVPNKTDLYKRQINYIEKTPKRTFFSTQLTAQTATSKLSDLSIVRTILDIRRLSEEISEEYKMEFINPETLGSLQRELQSTLSQFVSNGACESLSVAVTANAYDKTQKRCNVEIAIVPTSILERIAIRLTVK